MKSVRIDQVMCCEICGVELKVVKDCDSTCPCSIVCCGRPMTLKEGSGEDES